jgi:hypothetical protein
MTIRMPAIAKPLQPAFRVFQGNYNQLKQLLKLLEDSNMSFELISQYRDNWFSTSEEIARLLYNFIVSAATFIERTDDVFKDLPKIKELLPLIDEYNQEYRERFEKSGRHYLNQSLRHYLVHGDILEIDYTYLYERNKGHKYTIVIGTAQILTNIEKGNVSKKQGHGFNKQAIKELKNHGDGIVVSNLVEKYYKDIDTFYHWIWDKQTEFGNSHTLPI